MFKFTVIEIHRTYIIHRFRISTGEPQILEDEPHIAHHSCSLALGVHPRRNWNPMLLLPVETLLNKLSFLIFGHQKFRTRKDTRDLKKKKKLRPPWSWTLSPDRGWARGGVGWRQQLVACPVPFIETGSWKPNSRKQMKTGMFSTFVIACHTQFSFIHGHLRYLLCDLIIVCSGSFLITSLDRILDIPICQACDLRTLLHHRQSRVLHHPGGGFFLFFPFSISASWASQISDPMLANVSRTHCIIQNTGRGEDRLAAAGVLAGCFFFSAEKARDFLRCKDYGQQFHQRNLETPFLRFGTLGSTGLGNAKIHRLLDNDEKQFMGACTCPFW